MRFDPHKYQKAAIEFCIGLACAALFLDPGLGKTVIMLTVFSLLQKQKLNRRVLVVAPLRPAYSVWPSEARKWDHLKHLRVGILHGPDKVEVLHNVDQFDVCVINPEGLDWLLRTVKGKWPWDMLVIDESTRFKHATTQRFKSLKSILNQFSRRYILTGSPAPNGLLDLWGQVYILDGGSSLGTYFSHFRMSYFDQRGYGGYTWVPRPGAEEAIYEKLKPLALRMSAKDYLDLPPLIENVVEVELPGPAMRQYRQMEDALIATLEETTVTAANASVAWGKCRQIANGGLFHEGGEKWSHIHEAKVDAVEEIIEELSGKPALVAYEYRHDLDRLRRRFGDDVPFIGGGVTASRFRAIEADWNAGRLPILLAQPQSVAHGLNLQGTGAAVIDAGLTPDLEVDEQFVRRVWRQGQREAVIRHRIVAKETVDEVIVKMLHKKDRTQRALLDALKTHLRTRRAA
jgi:SNF2 family DNA or RNA helicase